MPGAKVNPGADDSNVTESIKKQGCNIFRSEANQKNIEMSECEYSSSVNSDGALQRSEALTKSFSTDVSEDEKENEDEDEEEEEGFRWKTKLENKRYIRLDHCDYYKVLTLLNDWNMGEGEIIFSVLSDSECDNDAGEILEVAETKPNDSVQNVKKIICSSLVEAAATTNAWIITGGLNKGVDKLIGNEVKQRLDNMDKIPQAVLGICNWDYGPNGDKFDIIPTGLSLNQDHTYFVLVDDGAQKKSGCDVTLRQMIEFAQIKWEHEDEIRKPLIYILIGGRTNSFRIVERALDNQIPVIIAMGTGGAADIISEAVSCKNGATLVHMPEVAEKLFNRIEELLIAGRIPATVVRQVITNIKAESQFELLFEIIELLGQTVISDGGEQQFRDEIANLRKITTNELLAGIKDLLVSKQTLSDSSNHSAANSEHDTVNRMRAVFEQVLVGYGIPQNNAMQAVNHLESDVVNEALTKIKFVFAGLKAIQTHDQKHLLINVDITGKEKESISSLIVETLKKVKWNNGSDLYSLFSDLDKETLFRQLLQDNWMRKEHESVFRNMLYERKTKYVKLMMEHIGNCSWLTKPEGPLEKDFRRNELCANLLKKIQDTGSNKDYKYERYRLQGKLLFIWCVLKRMHKTAMLFWEQGQDCLAMTLVAYDLSKKQKENLVDKKKGYDEMEQQTQFFEKLALDFMSKCHAGDYHHFLLLLLGSEVEDLDGILPHQIANKANFEAFFCTDNMRDMANAVWTARIRNHRKWKYVPLLLSEACPLLSPVLLRISLYEDDEKEVSNPDDTSEIVRHYFLNVESFLKTPLVKFSYRFMSCIIYLTLFSIVMLTDFRTKISPSEIALTIWTFILIVEEVRQAIEDISEYKNNGWNYFDIGALILYIIGFILRMIYHGDPTICPPCLYVARIILAFSLMVSFFRALQFLSIFDATGPTIYMIRQLVADLVSILLILTVFISAYGVVSNVILYPNQPLNAKLLKDVFYDAWWSVIQQFNREDALGSNCNKDTVSAIITAEYCSSTFDDNIDYVQCKENRCPANNWIVSVLLAFYALLTCIMLLNVLIAMFNATFSTINSKQKDVSKLQRYRLMYEYSYSSMVPPPLCVITYPYLILMYLRHRFKYWNCDSKFPITGSADEDAETGQSGDEPRVSENPPEAYKLRKILSQEWELAIAADFYREKRDKEGWPVARMLPQTSNKFQEKSWIKHSVPEFRKQLIEAQSSKETDSTVSCEKDKTLNRLMRLMTQKAPLF